MIPGEVVVDAGIAAAGRAAVRCRDEEIRVRERTEQLASANSQLRQEILEHARAERQRLDLVRRIVGAQEEERRRISCELHDQLGQLLTALRLRLEGLKQQTDPDKTSQNVQELMESAKHLEAEIDFLAWELRPSMLDDLGLEATLDNFVREWSEHTGITVAFHPVGLAKRRLTWLLGYRSVSWHFGCPS